MHCSQIHFKAEAFNFHSLFSHETVKHNGTSLFPDKCDSESSNWGNYSWEMSFFNVLAEFYQSGKNRFEKFRFQLSRVTIFSVVIPETVSPETVFHLTDRHDLWPTEIFSPTTKRNYVLFSHILLFFKIVSTH